MSTACADHVCESSAYADDPSWDSSPWTIFERASSTHAIVVLNTPINFEEAHVQRVVDIWNDALVRITVDGGTDRWLDFVDRFKARANPPHLITGDMDSIRPATLKYFLGQSGICTQVIVTQDQCQTDFTKALLELKTFKEKHSLDILQVLVLCDLSGRFDQTISTINTLYEAKTFLKGSNVYLMSVTNLTWLLDADVLHKIRIPTNLRKEKKCCGLLPIGQPCRVATSGLKWNLSNDLLEFGHLVSSSNTYDDSSCFVTIRSDQPLTWTMEIDSYLRLECRNGQICSNKL